MRLFALLLHGTVVIALTACGGHAAPEAEPRPRAAVTREVRMLSGGRLDLAEAVDVGVEVQVDAKGRADIGTLRLSGSVSGTARDAITQWIQDARFEPARREGVPVPGVYRTRVAAKLVGRAGRD